MNEPAWLFNLKPGQEFIIPSTLQTAHVICQLINSSVIVLHDPDNKEPYQVVENQLVYLSTDNPKFHPGDKVTDIRSLTPLTVVSILPNKYPRIYSLLTNNNSYRVVLERYLTSTKWLLSPPRDNEQPRVIRPSKNEYYLSIARQVAKRSTCLRRNYGAVIVKDDEIIATGYNGAARNHPNCCDVYTSCPRSHKNHNSGDYSDCPAVHAEQNAMLSAPRRDMIGSTLYLVGIDHLTGEDISNCSPCPICARMINNSGIEKVVTIDNQ